MRLNTVRAERRAAPKPARHPLGGSADVFVGRGAPVRRAAPKPARAPSGGRAMYSSIGGLQ
jgi:hypothetical protein